ncbi:hypothetical protein GCM10009785_10430 [Brooklawnia cerclae]|uniref:Uncharacterized protein n=1 Tax=Brooklawnia cerclae TaxID=349934 RepID=A0ABX0SQ21_9ACTN|nr:hypothetical protein [Brooklawnia cerclae]NIH58852.1 hypothetical protein [Brooklawnia cerclae]
MSMPVATAVPRARRTTPPPGAGVWWVPACLVVALAVAFCLFTARDLFPMRYVTQRPGATWTDRYGISYTVLAREQLDEVPGIGTAPVPADEGAVFLRYTVQVDGYVYLEGESGATVCLFSLVDADHLTWERSSDVYDELRPGTCRTDDSDDGESAPSQQVYPVFEVPESMVGGLVGLLPTNAERFGAPLLSEPD